MEIDRSKSKKWIKRTALAAGVAGSVGLWAASDSLSKLGLDEPGAEPQPPAAPQRVIAKRGPATIGLMFDTSRSEFMNDLLFTTAETRRFIEKTKALRDGDDVLLCTFTEKPDCKDFKIPEERLKLLDALAEIKPEKPRKEMRTRVHESIRSVLKAIRGGTQSLLVVNTDGIEEDKGPKSPIETQTEVVLAAKLENLQNARAVRAGLGADRATVVNTDETGFGEILERFSGELDARETARAQSSADAAHEQAMERHRAKLKQYDIAERRYETALAKRQSIERSINRGLKSVAGAVAAILAGLAYWKSRPKAYGYIIDVSGEFPRPLKRVPENIKTLADMSPRFPPVQFRAKRDGMYLHQSRVEEGSQIANNVFWFSERPSQKVITRLHERARSTSNPPDITNPIQ